MVHKTAPNGRRFVCYGSRNPNRLLTQNILCSLDLPLRIRLLAKFHHDHPETLYTKNVVNELSFLLIVHMTRFDIQIN
jgi:hypothetical protein